jgi:hypothetical protein
MMKLLNKIWLQPTLGVGTAALLTNRSPFAHPPQPSKKIDGNRSLWGLASGKNSDPDRCQSSDKISNPIANLAKSHTRSDVLVRSIQV